MKIEKPSEEELARRGIGAKPKAKAKRAKPQASKKGLGVGAELSTPTLRQNPPKEE